MPTDMKPAGPPVQSNGKFVNPAKYVYNVGKSIGYAAVDRFKEVNPTLTEFAEANSDLGKMLFESVKDLRGTFKKGRDYVIKSKVGEFAREYTKAAKEDIKSGKFYNKERADQMTARAGGDVMDFSDFDSDPFAGIDEDDDADISKIFDGDDDFNLDDDTIATIEATDHIASKVVGGINAGTMASAKFLSKAGASMLFELQKQNEVISNKMSIGMGAINASLGSLLDFNNKIMKTHVNNSQLFFTNQTKLMEENNQLLKKIIENQDRSAGITKQKTSSSSTITMRDVMPGSTPDLKMYAKRIAQNINGMSMGTFDMMNIFEGGNMLLSFAGSPFKPVLEKAIKAAVPKALDKSFEQLNKTMAGWFDAFINKMNTKKNNWMSDGFSRYIGQIFGIETGANSRFSTDKYNKGPIPYDGESKLALTHVLPSYLARIESLLTGDPERMFDYKTGKFRDMNSLKREFDSRNKRSALSASSDFIDMFEKRVLNKIASKDPRRAVEERNDIMSALENMLLSVYQNGTIINFNDKSEDGSSYGIDSRSWKVISRAMKSMSKSSSGRNTIMNLPRSLNDAARSNNSYLKDIEANGGLEAFLINGYDPGKYGAYSSKGTKLTYKDFESTTASARARIAQSRPASVLFQEDKYGNTLFDYVRELHVDIKNLSTYVTSGYTGGGYGKIKKGKSRYQQQNPEFTPYKITSKSNIKSAYEIDAENENRKFKDQVDKYKNRLRKDGLIDAKGNITISPTSINIDKIYSAKDEDIATAREIQYAIESYQAEDSRKNIKDNKSKIGSFFDKALKSDKLDPSVKQFLKGSKNIITSPIGFAQRLLDSVDVKLYQSIFGSGKDGKVSKDSIIGAVTDKLTYVFNHFSSYMIEDVFKPFKEKIHAELFGGKVKDATGKIKGSITYRNTVDFLKAGFARPKNYVKQTIWDAATSARNVLLGTPTEEYDAARSEAEELTKYLNAEYMKAAKKQKSRETRTKAKAKQLAAESSDVPGHASGSRMIKKSGLAVLSRGEMVIPSELNPYYSGITNKRDQIRKESKIREQFLDIRDQLTQGYIPGFARGTESAFDNPKKIAKLTGLKPVKDDNGDILYYVKSVNGSMRKFAVEKNDNGEYNVRSIYQKGDYEGGALGQASDKIARNLTKTIKSFTDSAKSVYKKSKAHAKDGIAADELMEKMTDDVKTNIKQYAPELVGGGLIGGGVSLLGGLVGGPLLGAAVGSATSLIINSSAVQDWLFGEKIDGRRQGNVLSADLSNNIEKYFPGMAKGAVVGGITSLLPFVPGGPVAGVVLGSAIGFAKRNESVLSFLFGEEVDGKRVGGILPGDLPKRLKEASPDIAIGSIAGALALPFGIVPNLLVGGGLGFMSTTETFKNAMFGKEGKDGKREGGVMGAIKVHVLNPLKDFGTTVLENTKKWFTTDMKDPITRALEPLTKQGSLILAAAAKSLSNGLNKLLGGEKLGVSLSRRLIDIIKPVGSAAGKVAGTVIRPAKALVSAPFKAVGALGNHYRWRHIKDGNASYMTAEERLEFANQRASKRNSKIFGRTRNRFGAFMNRNFGTEFDDFAGGDYANRLFDQNLAELTKDPNQLRILNSSLMNLVEGGTRADSHYESMLRSSTKNLNYILNSKYHTSESDIKRISKAIESGNDDEVIRAISKSHVEPDELESFTSDIMGEYANLKSIKAATVNKNASRKAAQEIFSKFGMKDIDLSNLSSAKKYSDLVKKQVESLNNNGDNKEITIEEKHHNELISALKSIENVIKDINLSPEERQKKDRATRDSINKNLNKALLKTRGTALLDRDKESRSNPKVRFTDVDGIESTKDLVFYSKSSNSAGIPLSGTDNEGNSVSFIPSENEEGIMIATYSDRTFAKVPVSDIIPINNFGFAKDKDGNPKVFSDGQRAVQGGLLRRAFRGMKEGYASFRKTGFAKAILDGSDVKKNRKEWKKYFKQNNIDINHDPAMNDDGKYEQGEYKWEINDNGDPVRYVADDNGDLVIDKSYKEGFEAWKANREANENAKGFLPALKNFGQDIKGLFNKIFFIKEGDSILKKILKVGLTSAGFLSASGFMPVLVDWWKDKAWPGIKNLFDPLKPAIVKMGLGIDSAIAKVPTAIEWGVTKVVNFFTKDFHTILSKYAIPLMTTGARFIADEVMPQLGNLLAKTLPIIVKGAFAGLKSIFTTPLDIFSDDINVAKANPNNKSLGDKISTTFDKAKNFSLMENTLSNAFGTGYVNSVKISKYSGQGSGLNPDTSIKYKGAIKYVDPSTGSVYYDKYYNIPDGDLIYDQESGSVMTIDEYTSRPTYSLTDDRTILGRTVGNLGRAVAYGGATKGKAGFLINGISALSKSERLRFTGNKKGKIGLLKHTWNAGMKITHATTSTLSAASNASGAVAKAGLTGSLQTLLKKISGNKTIWKICTKIFGVERTNSAFLKMYNSVGNISSKIASSSSKLAGAARIGGAALKAVTSVVSIAFAVKDFSDGYNNAANYLGILQEDTAAKYKIISGLTKTIINFLSLGFLGSDKIVSTVAGWLIKCFGMGDEELARLQAKAIKYVESFNHQYNSNLTLKDINDESNFFKNTTKKLKNFFKGKKTDTVREIAVDSSAYLFDQKYGSKYGAYSSGLSNLGPVANIQSGFISQLDPNYIYAKFNTDKDTINQTIGLSGCGPATATMALNDYFGSPVISYDNAINYALDSGSKDVDGGVNASYFGKLYSKYGMSANYADNKNSIMNMIESGPTVLLGSDLRNNSKTNSPFGPNDHYVVATGYSGKNVIIKDPEQGTSRLYPKKILNNAKLGIGFTNKNTSYNSYAKYSAAGSGLRYRRFRGGDSELLPQEESPVYSYKVRNTLTRAVIEVTATVEVGALNYGTVLMSDGKAGNISLGIFQWNNGRAAKVIQAIYSKNPQFVTSILGEDYYKITTSSFNKGVFKVTQNPKAALSEIISSSYGIDVQNKIAVEDANRYISKVKSSYGSKIMDPKIIVFIAQLINLGGDNSATSGKFSSIIRAALDSGCGSNFSRFYNFFVNNINNYNLGPYADEMYYGRYNHAAEYITNIVGLEDKTESYMSTNSICNGNIGYSTEINESEEENESWLTQLISKVGDLGAYWFGTKKKTVSEKLKMLATTSGIMTREEMEQSFKHGSIALADSAIDNDVKYSYVKRMLQTDYNGTATDSAVQNYIKQILTNEKDTELLNQFNTALNNNDISTIGSIIEQTISRYPGYGYSDYKRKKSLADQMSKKYGVPITTAAVDSLIKYTNNGNIGGFIPSSFALNMDSEVSSGILRDDSTYQTIKDRINNAIGYNIDNYFKLSEDIRKKKSSVYMSKSNPDGTYTFVGSSEVDNLIKKLFNSNKKLFGDSEDEFKKYYNSLPNYSKRGHKVTGNKDYYPESTLDAYMISALKSAGVDVTSAELSEAKKDYMKQKAVIANLVNSNGKTFFADYTAYYPLFRAYTLNRAGGKYKDSLGYDGFETILNRFKYEDPDLTRDNIIYLPGYQPWLNDVRKAAMNANMSVNDYLLVPRAISSAVNGTATSAANILSGKSNSPISIPSGAIAPAIKDKALNGGLGISNPSTVLANKLKAAQAKGSFISQLDPRYAYNKLGNDTIAKSGCGPATAAMAINGLAARGSLMDSTSAIAQKYMTSGGVSADYFQDVFSRVGAKTEYTQNTSKVEKDLKSGKQVVLMGRDPSNRSKTNSPFGPGNHYVLATGLSGNKVVVNDPELNSPTVYDKSILNSTKLGISVSGRGSDTGTLSLADNLSSKIQKLGEAFYGVLNRGNKSFDEEPEEVYIPESYASNSIYEKSATNTPMSKILSIVKTIVGSGSMDGYTAAQIARQFIGKLTYKYGSKDVEHGVSDCSGFTRYVYKLLGVDIGDGTYTQVTKGTKVSIETAKSGDIIFFKGTNSNRGANEVSHVGIWVGAGRFIHLGSSGCKEVIFAKNSYYINHFMEIRRVKFPNARSSYYTAKGSTLNTEYRSAIVSKSPVAKGSKIASSNVTVPNIARNTAASGTSDSSNTPYLKVMVQLLGKLVEETTSTKEIVNLLKSIFDIMKGGEVSNTPSKDISNRGNRSSIPEKTAQKRLAKATNSSYQNNDEDALRALFSQLQGVLTD